MMKTRRSINLTKRDMDMLSQGFLCLSEYKNELPTCPASGYSDVGCYFITYKGEVIMSIAEDEGTYPLTVINGPLWVDCVMAIRPTLKKARKIALADKEVKAKAP